MIAFVVGAAGAVGAAVSARLAEVTPLDDLLLYDLDMAGVQVTAMDIAPVGAHGGVRAQAAGLSDIGAADIIVVCASRPHRAGMQRGELMAGNVPIIDATLARIDPAWSGLVVVISNPVDALVNRAASLLPNATVVGHAMNDTARFRHQIALATGRASTAGIDACWLGAHGGDGVAAWSAATGLAALTVEERSAIEAGVRAWYDTWQGWGTRRTTAYSSAAGLDRLVRAYLGDIGPVTLVLSTDARAYGSGGVALGLPVRVEQLSLCTQRWRLTDAELAGLHRDARYVQAMVRAAPQRDRVGVAQ